MGRLHSTFARAWRAAALLLICGAAGYLPAVASADELLPDGPLAPSDLAWLAVVAPVSEPPANLPPPALADAGRPQDQRVADVPSPGLQFAVDPDDGQVFLGWQFEF